MKIYKTLQKAAAQVHMSAARGVHAQQQAAQAHCPTLEGARDAMVERVR